MTATPQPSHDYSAFRPTVLNSSLLNELRTAAQQYLDAELTVSKAEKALDTAKQIRDHLQQRVIPDLMDRAETSLWRSENGGVTIEVENQLFAQITEENSESAIAWLEANAVGDVVKREFKILFGKGDEKWARKFQADLRRRKRPLNSAVRRTVHALTLRKTLRELLEQGVAVPLTLFGAFHRKVAKVTVAKATNNEG